MRDDFVLGNHRSSRTNDAFKFGRTRSILALVAALALSLLSEMALANGCGFQLVVSTAYTGACTNSGTIDFEVTNTGSITSTGIGFDNTGTVTTFTNAGAIDATSYGIRNNLGATITTLMNTGSITGSTGIYNAGVMTTLNNRQGASSTALTYTGTLPVNYNTIINAPGDYGKLSASSVTNAVGTSGLAFGIYSSSVLTNNTYLGVLSGLSPSNILSSSLTGTYGSYSWSLINSSGLLWDLVVSSSGGGGGSTPLPAPMTDLTPGTSFSLANIGVTANPVFSGGSLILASGDNSNLAFTVNAPGGYITSPASGSATLSGVFSGLGGLTINGQGMLILSGANTYSGGTTIASGILSVGGVSPTGTGDVFVASGAQLRGTGTITGALNVAGTLKPGNSPGYLTTGATVTMQTGSVYMQDIAGTTQASSSTPSGSTGSYSFLNTTGGQFVIQPGVNLAPRLNNLFSASEAGYGSPIYTPVLGDKFTILTANSGLSGRFATVTQPAALASGTQFIPFYNFADNKSIELSVIPTSYSNFLASSSANTRSVANVFDQLIPVNFAGIATSSQEKLLYAGAAQSAASLPGFAQSLAGEVYGASLAVVPQTSQRVQQAVMNRLGDQFAMPGNAALGTHLNNNSLSNGTIPGTTPGTTPGGAPGSNLSSNLTVGSDPGLSNASMAKGAAWGEVSYQRGNRSGDNNASGYSSNLYQAVFGTDVYAEHGLKFGGGLALSNTNVAANGGSSTVQQASVFLYGKLPVDTYVFDGLASYGFNTTDHSRSDLTLYTSGLQAKGVRGNDALLSVGISRPFEGQEVRLTPYARLTWQQVTQSGFTEGPSPAALTIDRYSGSGVRGVLGLALGSTAIDPMRAKFTYRLNVGVGADSPNLLNPNLNASLAGFSTNISTPDAGSTFVQAGLFATTRFADNAFAYAGLSTEIRSGQNLSNVSVGLRVQF